MSELEAKVRSRCREEAFKDGERPCLIWCGALHAESGQGRIRVGQSVLATHRLMWSIAHLQDPPEGQLVVQRCGRHACCEPSHLQLATTGARRRAQAARGLVKGRVAPRSIDECLRAVARLRAQRRRMAGRIRWLRRRAEMLQAQLEQERPTS